jgi:hypothetical protein
MTHPRHRPRSKVAAAAAIALVLAACGSPVPTGSPATLAPTASPTLEASSTTPLPTAPPTTPPTTSPPTIGGYRWIPVDPAQFGGVSLTAVTSTGTRLFAFGDWLTAEAPDSTPRYPTAWTSPDGHAWTRLPDSQAFVSRRTYWEEIVADVVPDGQSLVAVGMEEYTDGSSADAAAWFSPDGMTWTRAKVTDGTGRTMDQVIATDHGFVAIGEAEYSFHAGFGGGTAIWTSPDGRTWTLQHDKRTPPRGTALRSILADGPGFLASASFEYSEGFTKPLPPVTAGIWRSTDAIHWSPIPGSPLGVREMIRTSSGLVAIGLKGDGDAGHPVSWRSSDSRSWSSVEFPSSNGPAAGTTTYPQRLVGGPAGLLAFGERVDDLSPDDFSAVAWSSADGTAWSALDVTAIVDGVTVDLVRTVRGTILLIGYRMVADVPQPVVWLLAP